MKLNAFAVFVACLFIIAVGNVLRVINSPTDGTTWKDVPSSLYVTESFPVMPVKQTTGPQGPEPVAADTLHVGDLLLAVNGQKVSNLMSVQRISQSLAKEATVELQVFRPAQGTKHTARIAKAAMPERFLREIPPAVYVADLFKGSAAERAGIQKGDLILRINHEQFTEPLGFHPLRQLFGTGSAPYSIVANLLLVRAGVGSTLPFEVLHQNKLHTIPITLMQQGIPGLTYLLRWVVGFLALVWVMAKQQMAMVWLGRFCLFMTFFLLVGDTTNVDAPYAGWAGLRDAALAISAGLIFVHARPWWFAPLTIRLPRRWFDTVRVLRFHRSVNPRFLPAACIAVAIVWGLSVWHSQTPLPEGISPMGGYDTLAGLRIKLFERGVIPPIILGTLLVGLHYLWQIWRKKLAPLSPTQAQNHAICQAADAGNFEAMITAMNEQIHSRSPLGYYGRRVYQLIEHLNKDPDRVTLMNLSNALLADDEDDASRAFVPVAWCEVALPLWGFLGTIVGMGNAIGVLAHAVLAIFAGTANTDIAGGFTQAFQGMGVAFDTTFWGLVGVLTLSFADRALKKRIATRLAEARDRLGRLISYWNTSSVAGELVEVNVRLHGVAAELERAKTFRETMRTLVEHVITEVPGYEPIRDALFEPVVMFEKVLEGLGTTMIQPITATLGQAAWHFACIGLPVSAAAGGVVAVRRDREPGGDYLLQFDLHTGPTGALLPTTYQFTQLLPTRDVRTVFGRTTGNQLLHLSLPPSEEQGDIEITEVLKNGETLDGGDDVLQITVDQRDIAIIVRQTGQRAYDVFWQELRLAGSPELQHLVSLSTKFDWVKRSVHGPSAMLLVAGYDGTRWHLQRLPIQKRVSSAGRAAPLELVTDLNRWVELPPGVVPHHIVALPQEAILVLDTQGTLHYGHPTRQLRPLRPHPRWVIQTPHDVESCQIRSGKGNWIAVVTNDRLSMWWVSRSRAIFPYEKNQQLVTFRVTDPVVQQMLQTTADGQYLVTVIGQAIPTWTFPRLSIEELA